VQCQGADYDVVPVEVRLREQPTQELGVAQVTAFIDDGAISGGHVPSPAEHLLGQVNPSDQGRALRVHPTAVLTHAAG